MPLLEKTPESSPLFAAPHLVGTQEDSHLPARKRVLSRHQVHDHLDLGLLASGTMRNKCVLFKPLGAWRFDTGDGWVGTRRPNTRSSVAGDMEPLHPKPVCSPTGLAQQKVRPLGFLKRARGHKPPGGPWTSPRPQAWAELGLVGVRTTLGRAGHSGRTGGSFVTGGPAAGTLQCRLCPRAVPVTGWLMPSQASHPALTTSSQNKRATSALSLF